MVNPKETGDSNGKMVWDAENDRKLLLYLLPKGEGIDWDGAAAYMGTNKKSISNRLTKLRAERNATTGGDPSVYTSKSKSAAKASASKEATTKGRGGKKPKAANDSAKRKAEDDDNDDEKESKKAKVEDEDEEAEEVNKGV